MRRSMAGYTGMLCCVLCLSVTACGDAPLEPSLEWSPGSWYVTGFRWPHDGRPFTSEHFVIYSDGASDEARAYLAQDPCLCIQEPVPAAVGRVGLLRRVVDLCAGSPGAGDDRAFVRCGRARPSLGGV